MNITFDLCKFTGHPAHGHHVIRTGRILTDTEADSLLRTSAGRDGGGSRGASGFIQEPLSLYLVIYESIPK